MIDADRLIQELIDVEAKRDEARQRAREAQLDCDKYDHRYYMLRDALSRAVDDEIERVRQGAMTRPRLRSTGGRIFT